MWSSIVYLVFSVVLLAYTVIRGNLSRRSLPENFTELYWDTLLNMEEHQPHAVEELKKAGEWENLKDQVNSEDAPDQ